MSIFALTNIRKLLFLTPFDAIWTLGPPRTDVEKRQDFLQLTLRDIGF